MINSSSKHTKCQIGNLRFLLIYMEPFEHFIRNRSEYASLVDLTDALDGFKNRKSENNQVELFLHYSWLTVSNGIFFLHLSHMMSSEINRHSLLYAICSNAPK